MGCLSGKVSKAVVVVENVDCALSPMSKNKQQKNFKFDVDEIHDKKRAENKADEQIGINFSETPEILPNHDPNMSDEIVVKLVEKPIKYN